ncbi:hypothetical protein NPIL_147121 [Nephila pilipes]|uniref:C2H2-type domain-containing protein n=1 Tax=Nephila pilipes TaxID=299642 RepID=A0A8X6UNA2_NEPPI|nr:hypothetical protein NPIL_147121 [Nephila pilipes]
MQENEIGGTYSTTTEDGLKMHFCFFNVQLLNEPQVESKYNVFSCSVCSYSTRFKSWFEKHFRTHTGERPFILQKKGSSKEFEDQTKEGKKGSIFFCSLCSFSSLSKDDICQHMSVHTNRDLFDDTS